MCLIRSIRKALTALLLLSVFSIYLTIDAHASSQNNHRSHLTIAWNAISKLSDSTGTNKALKLMSSDETQELIARAIQFWLLKPQGTGPTSQTVESDYTKHINRAVNFLLSHNGYLSAEFEGETLEKFILAVDTELVRPSQMDGDVLWVLTNLIRPHVLAGVNDPSQRRYYENPNSNLAIQFQRSWAIATVGAEAPKLAETHAQLINRVASPWHSTVHSETNWVCGNLSGPVIKDAISRIFPQHSSAIPTNIFIMTTYNSNHFRTLVEIKFKETLKVPRVPWVVPTHLVHEPLVCFVAARNINLLLTNVASFINLPPSMFPEQLYYWTTDGLLCQSFIA